MNTDAKTNLAVGFCALLFLLGNVAMVGMVWLTSSAWALLLAVPLSMVQTRLFGIAGSAVAARGAFDRDDAENGGDDVEK